MDNPLLSNFFYNEDNNKTTSRFSSSSSTLLGSDFSNFELTANTKLTKYEEILVIVIFLILIVLGIFGNLLVIWTVLANKTMRTSNNLFILNLAISDLTLCIFSIPFNAYKTLRHDWIFGEFLCGLTPFFQASNVFVSSMSITAIALDRFVHIVCAMKVRKSHSLFQSYGAIGILIFIWLMAFLLSSPLFLFSRITFMSFEIQSNHTINIQHEILKPSMNSLSIITEKVFLYNMTEPPDFESDHIGLSKRNTYALPIINQKKNLHHHKKYNLSTKPTFILNPSLPTTTTTKTSKTTEEPFEFDLDSYKIYHCVENWPEYNSRMIYSYFTGLIQYILPFIIVGISYGSIWWKLKRHRNKLKMHSEAKNLAAKNLTSSKSKTKLEINVELNLQSSTSVTNINQSIVNNSQFNSNSNNNNNHNETLSRKSTCSSQENRRHRRMNILLAFIAIIYAISWLPLNIFNTLSDLRLNKLKPNHAYYLINVLCVLLGMSSAVSNPCLYGVFNENFKREYVKLCDAFFKRITSCFIKKPRIQINQTAHQTVQIKKEKSTFTNTNESRRLLEASQQQMKPALSTHSINETLKK